MENLSSCKGPTEYQWPRNWVLVYIFLECFLIIDVSSVIADQSRVGPNQGEALIRLLAYFPVHLNYIVSFYLLLWFFIVGR